MEMRLATAADDGRLLRLAQRDSASVPQGQLVIAEQGAQLLAALSLDTGVAIADPFMPTAATVAALRAWTDPPRPSLLERVRSALTSADHAHGPRLDPTRIPTGSLNE